MEYMYSPGLYPNCNESDARSQSSVLVDPPEQQHSELRSIVFGRNHTRLPFPIKLHRLVSCETILDMFWVNDGKSFAVHKQGYEQNIMSVLFKQHQFKCFQVMLERYGFHVVTKNPDFVDFTGDYLFYANANFIAGREDLCNRIVDCRTVKKQPVPAKNSTRGPDASHQDSILPVMAEDSDHLSLSPDSLHQLLRSLSRTDSFSASGHAVSALDSSIHI